MKRTSAPRCDAESQDRRRGLALIRIATVPVLIAGGWLTMNELEIEAFEWVIVAATAYSLAALVESWRKGPHRLPECVYATFDLLWICALTYTSGGGVSQFRFAFFVVPVAAAFLRPPGATALASSVTVIAYLGVSISHLGAQPSADVGFVLSQALYLAWMGLVAVLLSRALERRARRIAQLSAGRGRLVAQALEAEERARRGLAEALHDEALQNLLSALQDLEATRRGDRSSLARAELCLERTVEQLRTAVFDLHPPQIEYAGLAAALEAVAEQQGRRGGYQPTVRVYEEATGAHDQLLLSLGRELLVNAAKHARATELSLTIERLGPCVVLEAVDDGRGIDADRLASAPREGHIGLASGVERVEALGGTLAVSSTPDRGTTVRAVVPVLGSSGPAYAGDDDRHLPSSVTER